MTNASNLKQQIGQLCKLILTFQKYVQDDRQKLFTQYSMTDQSLWNYVFGGNIEKISKNQLYIFLHKHNSPQKKQDCKLICQRYSEQRNGFLNKINFWELFRPRCLPMMQKILQIKKGKSILCKMPEIDIRAKKLIVSILEKTIQYQKHAQIMKQNIKKYQKQFSSFSLKKVQAKYLQMYLIEHLTEIRLKDCQNILKHIVGKKLHEEKHFYTFFLSQKQAKQNVNPLSSVTLNVEDINQKSLKLFSGSQQIWNYGKNYKSHSKPLYLLSRNFIKKRI